MSNITYDNELKSKSSTRIQNPPFNKMLEQQFGEGYAPGFGADDFGSVIPPDEFEHAIGQSGRDRDLYGPQPSINDLTIGVRELNNQALDRQKQRSDNLNNPDLTPNTISVTDLDGNVARNKGKDIRDPVVFGQRLKEQNEYNARKVERADGKGTIPGIWFDMGFPEAVTRDIASGIDPDEAYRRQKKIFELKYGDPRKALTQVYDKDLKRYISLAEYEVRQRDDSLYGRDATKNKKRIIGTIRRLREAEGEIDVVFQNDLAKAAKNNDVSPQQLQQYMNSGTIELPRGGSIGRRIIVPERVQRIKDQKRAEVKQERRRNIVQEALKNQAFRNRKPTGLTTGNLITLLGKAIGMKEDHAKRNADTDAELKALRSSLAGADESTQKRVRAKIKQIEDGRSNVLKDLTGIDNPTFKQIFEELQRRIER